jgi:hypothetical protein
MKKNLIIIIIILCLAMAFSVGAQKLTDLYKKGTIRLVPDTEYAKGNNWDQLFRSYQDSLYGKHIGARKSLVLTPDGSVVVNHAYRNYYTLFSPQGKFVKEFGIRNAKGETLKKVQGIEGVINGNTFFTGLNNMGYMNCMDFNGKRIKTLRLNYMTKEIIALPNRKMAVVGWAIWEKQFRDFVAIVNYDDNSEKVIWEHLTPREEINTHSDLFNYGYQYKDGGAISFSTMPFSKNVGMNGSPTIACVGNKLIVAIAGNGEIREYDLNGHFLTKKKIGWEAPSISVEEQKQIQRTEMEKFKSVKLQKFRAETTMEEVNLAHENILRDMKADLNKITEPIPIPYFSTVIKDSDGNLLFFEYPKAENQNTFHVWVYENGGKFVCESRFVCDDYELNINPSRMVFRKGYIYSLQTKKNASGIPLRLVRFRLSNK